MQLLRTILISSMTADPDWVGDEDAAELDDDEFLKLNFGWTDVEWVLLYVDANGERIGADTGTLNAQVTFRQMSAEGVASETREKKYWRGATQAGVTAGVLQRGDIGSSGGKTGRPIVEATVRMASAIASQPTAAVSLQLWMQEA